MLYLYDAEELNLDEIELPIIKDVEEGFLGLQLEDDNVTRRILKEIEQAEYYSPTRVTDRFGAQIYISELSTGCKAALCVQHYPDKVIDTIECGSNARDAIIRNCTKGHVIFYNNDRMIISNNKDVNICLKNKIFHSIEDLNDFMGSYDYYKEEV